MRATFPCLTVLVLAFAAFLVAVVEYGFKVLAIEADMKHRPVFSAAVLETV